MSIADVTLDVELFPTADMLADWRWLVPQNYSPLMMSVFGDLFLTSPDGAVHFLDLVSGKLNRVADEVEQLDDFLRDPKKLDEWLMPDLVYLLRDRDMLLGEGECYGFKIPPILGGKITPDNIEPSGAVVYFSIFGQIHRQVKNLPPGTTITGFKVDQSEP